MENETDHGAEVDEVNSTYVNHFFNFCMSMMFIGKFSDL